MICTVRFHHFSFSILTVLTLLRVYLCLKAMGARSSKVKPSPAPLTKSIRAAAYRTHAAIGMTDRQYEVKFQKDIAGKPTLGVVRDGTFETRPIAVRWCSLPPDNWWTLRFKKTLWRLPFTIYTSSRLLSSSEIAFLSHHFVV